MEFLGVGPLELFFIILIALIILGPRDMAKAGRTLGRLMRKTILSPTWLTIQKQIRALPYEMMREAGLEEEDLKVDLGELGTFPTTAPPPTRKLPAEPSADVPDEWVTPQSSQVPADWTQTPVTRSPLNGPREEPGDEPSDEPSIQPPHTPDE